MDPFVDIRIGDVREVLDTLPAQSVHMGVTSPPYWGLRNYQAGSQEIGSEPTFEQHVEVIVDVMARVHRVLRNDGVFWFNYGDAYARSETAGVKKEGSSKERLNIEQRKSLGIPGDCKDGDLIGMPWQIAFALRDWGWYLRTDVIWHKPNAMPESVTNRPTRSHEYMFLLSKSKRYFYDIEATKEPYAESTLKEARTDYTGQETKDYANANAQLPSASKRRILESVRKGGGRQKRDVWADPTAVWSIPVQPYRGGHFATFPERLVEPCILAGTSGGGCCGACGVGYRRLVEKEPIPDDVKAKFEEARARTAADTGRTDGHTNYRPNFKRGTKTIGWQPACDCVYDGPNSEVAPIVDAEPCVVLDPFCGSGRAGMVARRLGRSFIGIELNVDYAGQALENIYGVEPEKVA